MESKRRREGKTGLKGLFKFDLRALLLNQFSWLISFDFPFFPAWPSVIPTWLWATYGPKWRSSCGWEAFCLNILFLREMLTHQKTINRSLISLAQMIGDGGAESSIITNDHGYTSGPGEFSQKTTCAGKLPCKLPMMEHCSMQSWDLIVCQWNSFESTKKPLFVASERGFLVKSLSDRWKLGIWHIGDIKTGTRVDNIETGWIRKLVDRRHIQLAQVFASYGTGQILLLHLEVIQIRIPPEKSAVENLFITDPGTTFQALQFATLGSFLFVGNVMDSIIHGTKKKLGLATDSL